MENTHIKIIIALAILMILSLVMSGCENEQDVKNDIEKLKLERTDLQIVNKMEKAILGATRDELEALRGVVNATSRGLMELRVEQGMVAVGKEPMYILKLKMKQSRTSLSISKHMKDNMNAIKFDIPVSREFYKNVNVGTSLVDDFRAGSFIMNGSFSNWKITVIEKSIQ